MATPRSDAAARLYIDIAVTVSGCFSFTALTIYVSLTNENKNEFFNNLSTHIGMRSVVGAGMKKIRVSCVGWKPTILSTAGVPLGSLVWLQ